MFIALGCQYINVSVHWFVFPICPRCRVSMWLWCVCVYMCVCVSCVVWNGVVWCCVVLCCVRCVLCGVCVCVYMCVCSVCSVCARVLVCMYARSKRDDNKIVLQKKLQFQNLYCHHASPEPKFFWIMPRFPAMPRPPQKRTFHCLCCNNVSDMQTRHVLTHAEIKNNQDIETSHLHTHNTYRQT